MTLIRLGIFRGKGKILFGPARFQADYQLLNQIEIQKFYKGLVNTVSKLPMGPWHALQMLLGFDGAMRVAAAGDECDIPDSVKNMMHSQPGSSRSTKKGEGEEEEEEEYIDLGSD